MIQACKIKDLSFSIRQRYSFSKIPVLAVLGVLMLMSWTAPCLTAPSIQMRIAEDFIQNRCVAEGQSEKHLGNKMMAGHLQPLWPSKSH